MPDSRTAKAEQKMTFVKKKDRAAEIANTFEWLITAFILAFVFRAFVMEAFRIPTGSMADTLKGAHFRLRCPQCGYEYDHGFVPQNYGMPEDTVPSGAVPVRQQTRCPSCGFYVPAGMEAPVANGDRILVLKCIYQFLEPRRWDVIVFKNPVNPTENYIKRLIGLPGDTVEIIDGDIYINGLIARKPPEIQKVLWMPGPASTATAGSCRSTWRAPPGRSATRTRRACCWTVPRTSPACSRTAHHRPTASRPPTPMTRSIRTRGCRRAAT
jgi:signal peptidase I